MAILSCILGTGQTFDWCEILSSSRSKQERLKPQRRGSEKRSFKVKFQRERVKGNEKYLEVMAWCLACSGQHKDIACIFALFCIL